MIEYERGGTQSPPSKQGAIHTTVTMVWQMKNMEEGGGILKQETESYVIHVSGTK